MSNLAKAERSTVVRENDKDVRENDRLLAEVRRPMDLSVYASALTSHSGNLITANRTSAEERVLTEDLNICLKNIIHTLEKHFQTTES